MPNVPRWNTRTLALFDGAHSKYWQIGVLGTEIHVRFGRADMVDGLVRFRKTQKHVIHKASFEDACAEAEHRYDAQLRQGYVAAVPADKSAVYRPKQKRHASKKRVSVRSCEKQIRTVEEFNICFVNKKTGRVTRSDRRGLPNYAGRYKRRLDGRKKVKDWIRLRFSKLYPADLIAEVLDGEGRPVPVTRSLRAVRKTYSS